MKKKYRISLEIVLLLCLLVGCQEKKSLEITTTPTVGVRAYTKDPEASPVVTISASSIEEISTSPSPTLLSEISPFLDEIPVPTEVIVPTKVPTSTPIPTKTPTPTKEPTKAPMLTKAPTSTKAPIPTKTPVADMTEYYPTSDLGVKINEYRVENGCKKVKTTDLLMRLAKERLAELHETGLSHYRPNGSKCFTLFEENGILRRFGGEILHSSYDLTATTALYGWSLSTEHKEILLDDRYTLVGCAMDDTYAVAMFLTLME